MATPVSVTVQSDDPSPVAVVGMVIQFYTTGGVFVTSGTTDSTGKVAVMLPDADYNVLFYKQGVSILPKQPQRITVDHTAISNDFLVTGHVKSRPESIDPLRCTISGYILSTAGLGANHRLVFETVNDLLVLSDNVIAPYTHAEVPSDDTGYFEFELLRNTKYNAYFVFPQNLFNQQPGKLDCQTPDSPSAPLADFLFPVQTELDFSATTISLVQHSPADSSITYTVRYSDGSTRTTTSTAWSGLEIASSDTTIADAAFGNGFIAITPLSPGTATITATRIVKDSATISPIASFTSQTITVTVTA